METVSFGLLDILIFGIIGVSGLFGLWRGLIASVLSLGGWFFSIYLTYKFYPSFSHIFVSGAKETMGGMMFGHVAVLIVLLIFFSFLNSIILTITGPLRVGFVDNVLGLVFGAARGALVSTFLYLGIVASINLSNGGAILFDDNKEKLPHWIANSHSYNFMQAERKVLMAVLPQKTQTDLHSAYSDLTKKGLDERFANYALQNITALLPLQDRTELNTYQEANSMRKSAFALQTDMIEKALDAYDRGISSGIIAPDTVPAKELDRLRAILQTRRASIGSEQPVVQ